MQRIPCFNSILVRLKDVHMAYLKKRAVSFNSILVRLKEKAIPIYLNLLSSFNSILVRLKAHVGASLEIDSSTFQFHTGSIKRNLFGSLCISRIRVSIPYWFD